MARSINQKLKLLYIVDILNKQSDEEHPVSTKKLIDELAKHGIEVERKTIYADIEQLIQFGYDIVINKSKKNGGYYMASRIFELSELKLLVDSIQASRFITVKKSRELITKLENLAARYDADQLKRDVFVQNRVKTDNESIYYVINDIYIAFQRSKQIEFRYMDWTIKKEKAPRKNGKKYAVSPFALTIKDENYYLIAYDREADSIKHFRVDKIKDIEITDKPREGAQIFKSFDVATYTNRSFGMYGGEVRSIRLTFPNEAVGIVIDRFGTDIEIRGVDEKNAMAKVEVAVSDQFYGWLSSVSSKITISGPEDVKKDYVDFLKGILDRIENTHS